MSIQLFFKYSSIIPHNVILFGKFSVIILLKELSSCKWTIVIYMLRFRMTSHLKDAIVQLQWVWEFKLDNVVGILIVTFQQLFLPQQISPVQWWERDFIWFKSRNLWIEFGIKASAFFCFSVPIIFNWGTLEIQK